MGAVEQVTARIIALAEWFDHVVELSRNGGAAFRRAEIADHLAATSECHVTWNWADPDGHFGFEVQGPLPGDPGPLDVGGWVPEAMRSHPLLVWFAHTGDPTPMSAGRVPRELVAPMGWAYLTEALGPHDCDQQLSIPYRLGTSSYRAFVLAQSRQDFADEQLDLARRLQPLLAVLDRQAGSLAQVPRSTAVGEEAVLTCREVAVLRLLADGLTAAAIGRRLWVSPRTVHCHLGHIYRKLGVSDRMMAGWRRARSECCRAARTTPTPTPRVRRSRAPRSPGRARGCSGPRTRRTPGDDQGPSTPGPGCRGVPAVTPP